MLKKIIFFVSLFMLLFNILSIVYAEEPKLLESDGSYITLEGLAARQLYSYGIIDNIGCSGVDESFLISDLKFDEQLELSRLESFKLIYNLFPLEMRNNSNISNEDIFIDVPIEYKVIVNFLYNNGIVYGTSSNTVGIGPSSLEQFCTLLLRYLNIPIENSTSIDICNSLGLLENIDFNSKIFSRGIAYMIVVNLLNMNLENIPNCRFNIQDENFIILKDIILNGIDINKLLRPQSIELTVNSYEDFLSKFNLIYIYAPYEVRIVFSSNCSYNDKLLIYMYFQKGKYSWDGLFDSFIDISSMYSFGIQNIFVRYSTVPDSNILYDFKTDALLDNYISDLLNFSNNFDGYSIVVTLRNYSDYVYLNLDSLDWIKCLNDSSYTKRAKSVLEDMDAYKGLSDYEKVYNVNRYICSNSSYDYNCYNELMSDNVKEYKYSDAHTIYGFLDDGKIVCDGYAYVYQWLLSYLGIDSTIVYGTSTLNNKDEGHAWNKVKIDGIWYNDDVCWADTGCGLSYFLKSDDYFLKNYHIASDTIQSYNLPSLKNYKG